MPSQFTAPDAVLEPQSSAARGLRSQALQRLQVGGSLLVGIVLIVGLANVIEERAKQSDQAVVPEAAATVAPVATQPAAKDPLADAGVVPDLPAEPAAAPAVDDGPRDLGLDDQP
jgi:hypothetical protein